jgi:hypothetical protein
MFIWIYLVINSIISENLVESFDFVRKKIIYPQKDSAIRSVGFIRFVIFYLRFNIFSSTQKNL